ncbi:MAG: MBL fold metallo-hydrolase [Deltaproteobacteria bacterium]|nr:MBL fold metallo-hydrolase [Deltaproteobacteria bacterium]
MKITILGSGTATPFLDRNSSGLFIQAPDLKIIVDMGAGTLRRMCEAGIDYKEIDLIMLTHFHPDHVTDFISFLFASNYAYGPMRTLPFHVLGPTGLEQFFNRLVETFGEWVVPIQDRLILQEMSATSPDEFRVKGALLKSVPAAHSFPCLSYRLETEGKTLTISGDTDFNEDLIRLSEACDTLICECSMPDSMKVSGHMTPSEAALVAQRASVKRLILTHFYPPCDAIDVISEAQSVFQGTILKAEDLMTVEL